MTTGNQTTPAEKKGPRGTLWLRWIRWINRVVLIVAGSALALMMFLTAVDVAFRYLFNSPIAGALETVEYIMAVLIPLSIAYCAFEGSHVAVELIVVKFPKFTRTFLEVLVTAAGLVFVAVITWQNIVYIEEIYASNLTSAVLLIPTYPFVVPTAIGFGVFALLLAAHLFDLITNKGLT